MVKLGRPFSAAGDGNRTGSPKQSGNRRLPSNQEIQEAAHDYNYPDLTLLQRDVNLPPAPDISTLPKKNMKRKQALRNVNKLNYPVGKRSFSVPGTSDRRHDVPITRTNVSMKARLFERKDSDSGSDEYLYPKASPKHTQKRFIPPSSKPPLVNKPFHIRVVPENGTKAEINANHVGNARSFLASNLPPSSKFSNTSPRPWKPPSQQKITNINTPPEYVDMENSEVISLNPGKEKSFETPKIKPVGKVVGEKVPISREPSVKQFPSDKLFNQLSVVELVDCLRKCGLAEMANVCQSEKLDGSFISQLSPEELQELNLSPIQIMKLSKVKSGWRPKTSQFS